MKSSIKVDFRSRYSGAITDKEPLVKVEVVPSEDPRDSLLADIFQGDPPKISIFRFITDPSSNDTGGVTYFICKKERLEQVYDIGSQVFEVLIESADEKLDTIVYVTGSDETWFESALEQGGNGRRSEVIKRNDLLHLSDKEVRRKYAQTFIKFINNEK